MKLFSGKIATSLLNAWSVKWSAFHASDTQTLVVTQVERMSEWSLLAAVAGCQAALSWALLSLGSRLVPPRPPNGMVLVAVHLLLLAELAAEHHEALSLVLVTRRGGG
mmetsp:Transcript_56534/g.106025  ORF Transcript_56534/g.106025 Transcript_56534/m.106025 type:complete len:108 (-) Transcript_56534:437-760(-)